MVTKTIVLNQDPTYQSVSNKNARGLVSIQGDDAIRGKLKLYNIEYANLRMIVCVDNQNFLFNDVVDGYTFEIKDSIQKDVFVLVQYREGEKYMGVVSGGKLSKDKAQLFAELSQEELDDAINHEDDVGELKILANQNIETSAQITSEKNFYSLIKAQIDELFARFPHFTTFEELIPNSEWVKVSFSDNEAEHYLLGKLYQNALVSHVCYAIPAESFLELPPKSLADFVQWIPLNPSESEGKGYWVMYQDAETGENVRV